MSELNPSLVLATDEEKHERDRLVHAEWGTRLTMDGFLERERVLRSTRWARRNMSTWLLVEGPERRVLSSLETFLVRSRHGIRNGLSFAIASVFTEHALRGQGYATRLLEAVAARLAENPRVQALTLYSDVGESLYGRAGFEPLPSFDWIVPARHDNAPGVARTDDESTVEALLLAHPPRGRFALLPDGAQVDWHRARERVYAALLQASAVAHGCLRYAEGHALIAGDLKNGRLVVLRLVARNVATAERLLRACGDEAARAGLVDVVAWAAPYGGDEAIGAAVAVLGGARTPRPGAIPMIRPLPAGSAIGAAAWSDVSRISWV